MHYSPVVNEKLTKIYLRKKFKNYRSKKKSYSLFVVISFCDSIMIIASEVLGITWSPRGLKNITFFVMGEESRENLFKITNK